MMISTLRRSLELFRLIPRSDLVAKVTPAHPTPDKIVPGEMTIVRDGVDKWACFHCPGGVRRDHQAFAQQEPKAQVDCHVRLAEAPNDLALGPADE